MMQTRQFKENVKGAAAYLQQQGFDVPHTQLLEAISRGFGERNWSTMRALLESSQQQPPTMASEEPATLSPVAELLSRDFYRQLGNGDVEGGSREQLKSILAETSIRLAPHATAQELEEALNAIWESAARNSDRYLDYPLLDACEAAAPPQQLSAVADLLFKDIRQQLWDGVFGMCSREQAESMLAETASRLAPNATPEELAEALNAIWVD